MADREVVALNTDTPQLEAPQGADNYVMNKRLALNGPLVIKTDDPWPLDMYDASGTNSIFYLGPGGAITALTSSATPLQLQDASGNTLFSVNSSGIITPTLQGTKGAIWQSTVALATPVEDVIVYIPDSATIKGWSIIGQPFSATGSCEIDIRKVGIGGLPATAAESIVNGNYPAIVNNNVASDSNLSSWSDVTLIGGETLTFHLNSTSNFTTITIQVYYLPRNL